MRHQFCGHRIRVDVMEFLLQLGAGLDVEVVIAALPEAAYMKVSATEKKEEREEGEREEGREGRRRPKAAPTPVTKGEKCVW